MRFESHFFIPRCGTGPPIRNPFSYLGSAPIARYYYFWYVVCSYPARLTHINPRCVLYGSSVSRSGFLLAALIPLYLRDFLGVTENLRRKSRDRNYSHRRHWIGYRTDRL